MARTKKRTYKDKGEYNAGSGVQSVESMDRLKLSAVKFIGENDNTGSGSMFVYNRWACILTNNHVCKDWEEAQKATIEFKDHDGNITLAKLNPSVYFVTHERLDFTVVALARWPRMKSGKGFPGAWDFLQLIKNPLPKLTVEVIISLWQHPEG